MSNVTATPAGREGAPASSNFLREIIDRHMEEGRYDAVVTRFPPEPNGYLHIGHAKSIVLNFGIAETYGGRCHLRFDDTNPETEKIEYVDSIKDSVRWLGFDWGDHEYYASDYFEQMYEFGVRLIREGKAYVDSLNEEEIRQYRGTVTAPGRESPYRNRPVEENLDLFARMRRGEFADGEHVLRGKGDMASANMKMRDPLLYRIKRAHHYRQGDAWCIYPMYDFAHPLEDAIEQVTHSLCTLEFDANREIYDWLLDNLFEEPRPHQYEFARLNLDYTVMSKRKLLQLVREGRVDGWSDPRMPTIAGMRRRGVTPEAIRDFCERIGVTKVESRVDIGLLEHSLRDDLNFRAPRVMCVVDPLKVVLTNYPEDEEEWLEASYWPHDVPREGTRRVPFSRELYIEREDFMEDPPKGYYRLAPGREVRLRYGYFITCEEVVRDEDGRVVELRCTYDPATRGGDAPDGRRVRGTLHWVSARHALPAEVRLYDRLFRVPDPDAGDEPFTAHLNPESVVVRSGARIEPSVAEDAPETRYQFERQGYFWRDPEDSKPDALVFNRIVSLRDTWAKKMATQSAPAKKPTPRPEGDGEARRAAAEAPTPRPPAEVRDPVEELAPEQRARYDRYVDELGLDADDAVILVQDAAVADFFEAALGAHGAHGAPQAVANWVVNELLRELKDTDVASLSFPPEALGRLVALIDEETISTRIAKEVFAEMMEKGGDPRAIVEERGLVQISDADALEPHVERVLEAYPEKAGQYRDGKKGLMGFFVGQVMKATRGKANPQLVQSLVEEKLG